MNEKPLNKIRLGEIFSYVVQYFDEEENKDVTETKEAFFIKVGDFYYLISKTDEEGEENLEFFDFISGMIDKNGKKKEGHKPFTFAEAIKYLKLKNVSPTGKFIVEQKKTKKLQKSSFAEALKGNMYKTYYSFSSSPT